MVYLFYIAALFWYFLTWSHLACHNVSDGPGIFAAVGCRARWGRLSSDMWGIAGCALRSLASAVTQMLHCFLPDAAYAMNIHEHMPWTALNALACAHLCTSLQRWAVTRAVQNQPRRCKKHSTCVWNIATKSIKQYWSMHRYQCTN